MTEQKKTEEELKVFIWRGHKAEAQSGYNDDLVMSFAIALWVRDTALKLRSHGLELNKRAIGLIGKNSGIYSSNSQNTQDWKMKIKGKDEDLTWLIK